MATTEFEVQLPALDVTQSIEVASFTATNLATDMKLKEAMKNKDMKTVGAIRLIIAGQKEKDVEARGKGLEKASDADLLSMMQTMIKQRNESVKIYTESNRPDLAEKEQAESQLEERMERWMYLQEKYEEMNSR